jgi:uncharacterized membrane protein
VRGQGRVLYVESDTAREPALYRALRESKYDVDLLAPAEADYSLGRLIVYDTIVLSNVSAYDVGSGGMRALEIAVKDWGVGLICIGGDQAFGPGGYKGSPLEAVLPVEMDIKHRRTMPVGALVVILHTCEVARGNYWAQQIALAALRVLSPVDEYGVFVYDWQQQDTWLFPLQKCRNKTALAQLIRTVQAGDMPSFVNAFEQSHLALRASSAAAKHCVVISDGDPGGNPMSLVGQMAKEGITVSAVCIKPHGPQDSQRLKQIARIGRGRYYEPNVSQLNRLPQIFIKEAATVRRAQISEETFTPRLAGVSPLLEGIAGGELPRLKGMVLTSAKPLADVPLVNPEKDPVLAHMQCGLGRTVAFTSDARAVWGAEWVSWAKYRQFWSQVVRWATRSVQPSGLEARTQMEDEKVRIVVDAVDSEGEFQNGLRFKGTVITPGYEKVPVAVEQIGPGRYETKIDAPASGVHYVSLRYKDAAGQSHLYTHGLVVPYSAEYRDLKTNTALLSELAEMTGGRMLDPKRDAVFARDFEAAPRYADVWPWLLLAAILLMPFDVFMRRVFVDYAAVAARLVAVVNRLPLVGRKRRVEPTPGMSALLSAKKQTREQFRRRAAKFAADAAVDADEAQAEVEVARGAPARPKAKTMEREAPGEAGPRVAREDETYMGRLLRAKRAAAERKETRED